MSLAIQAQGFKFEINTGGSPLGYIEVKEVTNFSGFDGQASEIDVTHLQSVAKEFLMGLQDFGSFQIDVNYIAADPGQVQMRGSKASRIQRQFRATFSDGSTAIFNGYVLGNPVSGQVDGKVDSSFTVRITGNVTFA